MIHERDIIVEGLDAEGQAGLAARLPQVRRSLLEGKDIGECRVHDCNGEVWLRFDLVGYGKTIRGIVEKKNAAVAGDIGGLSMVEEVYEQTEASSIAEAQAEKGVAERLEAFVARMNSGIEIMDAEILRPHGADIDNMAGDAFYVRVPPFHPRELPDEILRRGMTIGKKMQEKIKSEWGLTARCGMRYVEQDEIAFTAGIDHFAFAVGPHWEKLYAAETAAGSGAIWMDASSAARLVDQASLKRVENKGSSYFEVNDDSFHPSDPVTAQPLTISAEETQRVVDFVAKQSKELPKTSEHRPVFVTYSTIKGDIGDTKDKMLKTLTTVASVLKKVELETGLFFWKIDTSLHGDIVVLGMHEGTNGHELVCSHIEGIIRGHLSVQESLAALGLTVETAVNWGRMLRIQVGSKRRVIIDGMGAVINDAARQAQLPGIVVTAAAEPHLLARNIEAGRPVLLHGAKEMPDGVSAAWVTSQEDVRPIEPFVESAMGLLQEFETRIQLWATQNGIQRFDWNRIMDTVSEYVTGGDILFSRSGKTTETGINTRVLLEDIAVQLRADLRAGESAKQIEQSMATTAANSPEIQRAVDELKATFSDPMHMMAVLLGGKNTLLSQPIIDGLNAATGMNLEGYVDYLFAHRLATLFEDGRIKIFVPLHRRIYESMSNEQRRSHHATIARYYRDVLTQKQKDHEYTGDIDHLLRAFVYHGYESRDVVLLQDVRRVMPAAIRRVREQNDWPSLGQYADWFLDICTPEEKAQGLLWKGEALTQLGEFIDAYACYRAILLMPKHMLPKNFPLWEVEIEEAFTRMFAEGNYPHQDPIQAQLYRDDLGKEILEDLERIFDRVSGDRVHGVSANPEAQVKALRRIGEIIARTAGVDREQVKKKYGDYAQWLYEVRLVRSNSELWGTVAPIWGRLGGGIEPVNFAIQHLTRNYSPAYAASLASLYLAQGTYRMMRSKQDSTFTDNPEESVRLGLEYAKKSQNKQKMLEAMNNLADLRIKTNSLEGVDALVEEALELSDRVQHWYMKGATRELKGLLYLRKYLNTRSVNESDAHVYLTEALTHLRIASDHFLYIHSYGSEGIGMVRDDIAELFSDTSIPQEIAAFLSQLPTVDSLPA